MRFGAHPLMVRVSDPVLVLLARDGERVELRVSFDLIQDERERAAAGKLIWVCTCDFYGVDPGCTTLQLRSNKVKIVNGTTEETLAVSVDYRANAADLDEDPWWTGLASRDEIKAKIGVSSRSLQPASQAEAFTNIIQEQFG